VGWCGVRFAAERQRQEGRWIVKVKVLGENTVRLRTCSKNPGFTTDLPLEEVIGCELQGVIGYDTL
jgi:hypothetical protein